MRCLRSRTRTGCPRALHMSASSSTLTSSLPIDKDFFVGIAHCLAGDRRFRHSTNNDNTWSTIRQARMPSTVPVDTRGRFATFPAARPPTVAVVRRRERAHARVQGALRLDSFDRGRDEVIGDIGTGDPLADEGTTLILWLNPNVGKPGVFEHPLQVVQERGPGYTPRAEGQIVLDPFRKGGSGHHVRDGETAPGLQHA